MRCILGFLYVTHTEMLARPQSVAMLEFQAQDSGPTTARSSSSPRERRNSNSTATLGRVPTAS
jgi:hypothetical protein